MRRRVAQGIVRAGERGEGGDGAHVRMSIPVVLVKVGGD